MKSAAFLMTLALFASQAVSAAPARPCAPVVEIKMVPMLCQTSTGEIDIEIRKLASRPIPKCQGANRVEAYYAKASVRGGPVLELGPSEFKFKISARGEGFFSSPQHGIDARGCMSPLGGGASFGN